MEKVDPQSDSSTLEYIAIAILAKAHNFGVRLTRVFPNSHVLMTAYRNLTSNYRKSWSIR